MPETQLRRGDQGLTLIEVLVAMALFFVITVAVLQLYAASVAINLGSIARTDLVYRCERVVETIRWVDALKHQETPPDLSGYGVNLLGQAGTRVSLPTDPTNNYWGVGGANVIDQNARYLLSYTVTDNVDFWTVTVTAEPKGTGGLRYLGSGIPSKVVRYVAQLPKS
jgi:prepilin-type N-terminal cleavage/methylation domain-containing protein